VASASNDVVELGARTSARRHAAPPRDRRGSGRLDSLVGRAGGERV